MGARLPDWPAEGHGQDVEVTGLDHLYVTVADLARSAAFYDGVLALLGFRKGTAPVGGVPHAHYYNRVLQYTIRPGRAHAPPHDSEAPGFHHCCFRVADPAAVDAAYRGLVALGVDATPPRPYPEYAPDYYATFFADPDGLRLEIVNHCRVRTEIVERWDTIPRIGE